MTKNNAHLYLPLIQALAEGKTIQFIYPNKNEWEDIFNPLFNFPPDQYRIKPEPIAQEFYYIVEKGTGKSLYGGVIFNHDTLNDAKDFLKSKGIDTDKYTIMHAKAVEILD